MATKTISVDLEAYEKLSRTEWVPKSGTADQFLAWAKSCDTAHRLPDKILDELARLPEGDPVAADGRA